MKAVQRATGTMPFLLAPGEWCWQPVDLTSFGGPSNFMGLCYHSPNLAEQSYGMLNHRWAISGDGDTITVSPSIWILAGRGAEAGEWHGFLTNGQWSNA